MTASVLLTRHDHVAVLTLNDPQRRNILSAEMVDGIVAAVAEISADPEILCAVITGAGGTFCAGAHLGTLEDSAKGDFASVEHVYEGFLRVRDCPLPTIAAIEGPAVGAGLNLALACDIRIASETATFDSRFLKLSLHPGGGHTWMLTRSVGQQKAMAALAFGKTWTADDALSDGLVMEVVPEGVVVKRAIDVAAPLQGVDEEFVRRLTATVRASGTTLTHAEALAHETAEQRWSVTRKQFVDRVQRLKAAISRS